MCKLSVPTRNLLTSIRHRLLSLKLRICQLLTILVFLLGSIDARAQWTMTTPNLLNFNSAGAGAIVHKEGRIWAGTRELFLSRDLGLTWEQKTSPVPNNDNIRSIDFWDENTGLLATSLGDTWLTVDGATTWRRIRNTPSNWCARFIGSSQNIMIATASYGSVDVSSDGGATWTSKQLGNFVTYLEPLIGNTAYALVGAGRSTRIVVTTDLGKTWTPSNDSTGFDSYMFAVDPCSPERIYVVNEDAGGSPNNGLAEIFITSNGGASWSVTYSKPLRDLVGSISLASNAIYVQTMADGIYLSSDFGNTWNNIGGPSANFDTRLVCAVTDNLVLAADHGGNIWRTINAGGDSVHGPIRLKSLSATPDMLFLGDTLLSCEPPTYDTVVLTSIFCVAPKVNRVVIEGDHPDDFTITSETPTILTGSDTITLEFMPRGNGERRANIRIVMQDSTTLVIPMRGFGEGVTELSVTSSDVGTDTLGAEVYIPIRFRSSEELPGVRVQVYFETDQLEFVDAYDLNGASVASGSDPKRRTLTFDSPIPQDEIIGYVGLRVYAGVDSCMPVYFDSIAPISTKAECAFAINRTMMAHVCIPKDCIYVRVSDYLRYNIAPILRINQQRDHLLVTSQAHLGETTIRVVTILGAEVKSMTIELEANTPVRIPLDALHSGLYFIEFNSALGGTVLKQAISR